MHFIPELVSEARCGLPESVVWVVGERKASEKEGWFRRAGVVRYLFAVADRRTKFEDGRPAGKHRKAGRVGKVVFIWRV